jgi:hypothetical protein
MQPETGESAASINQRSDDAAWTKVRPLLEVGCTLHRPHRLRTFYPHDGVDHVGGTGGLTASRVKRLEREGVLTYVGPDRYALADHPSETR